MKWLTTLTLVGIVFAPVSQADPFWGAIEGGIEGAIIGGIIGGEEGAIDGAWIGGTAGAIDGAIREQERQRWIERERYYQRYNTTKPKRRQVVSSGSLVLDVQLELRRLGYDPGPADGVAGRATARALARYKSDYGLPNDGVINHALLQHMRSR